MRLLTKTALVVLLAGTAGGLALTPAAFAEEAAAPAAPALAAPADQPPGDDIAALGDRDPGRDAPGRQDRTPRNAGPWGLHGGTTAGRGALLDFACGDRGAEALEIAFVRLNYAVKPTTEQTPLLDALKTTALAGQKKVADACQAALKDTGGKASPVDRLQTRLAVDNARVAALTDVLPKFKAFYDSLTDEQKTKLTPRHAMAGGPAGQDGWQTWRHRPGQTGPMGPAHPGALPHPGGPAPDTPDAPAPGNPSSDT